MALGEGLRVGLITQDTYRIGAVEQLRKNARILGMDLEVVFAPEEIAGAMKRLGDSQAVLIDTAGHNPRDLGSMQRLGSFLAAAGTDEVHLVLSEGTAVEDARPILARYRKVAYNRLFLTKIDEINRPGRAPAVMGLLMASEMAVMVTTPEPPALMECYRTIKGLCRRGFEGEVGVVVNRAADREAKRTFGQLEHMVRSFLFRRIRLLTWIPDDPAVGRAVQQQVPLIRGFPDSRASQGIRRLGEAVTGEPTRSRNPARAFLRRLAKHMPGVGAGEGG